MKILEKYKGAPWLSWIGATILFFSWVSENYFAAERQGELSYLSQAQLHISIEEGHLSTWSAAAYAEATKEKPNYELLRIASFKAAQHQLNILTWATARVSDTKDHPEILKDKLVIAKQLTEAIESKDTDKIMGILSALTHIGNSRGQELIDVFQNRFASARESTEFWRKVFLFAYVIGSVFVVTGALKSWKRKHDH